MLVQNTPALLINALTVSSLVFYTQSTITVISGQVLLVLVITDTEWMTDTKMAVLMGMFSQLSNIKF